ncbi:MAG: acyltransferase [Chloroflexi bacterium AL-W]|nr:acyltransferase [Chloroflexi bacterium AL-N1]NOK67076.1 acyltransferase [Chloroflexi bacterium AL-N10]NOK74632.1 acyltransferase [Chloroflexi bacterium AL-N5]NOK81678.1 acyltransferase [Chloroflexi bacterium AL-W]NOK89148.1 acyltransferase [Chloroflexi bacterium AL-N15]
MLHFIPAPLLGCITFLGVALNTIFWCIPLFIISIVKLLFPIPEIRCGLSQVLARIGESWIKVNNTFISMGTHMQWEITGLEKLDRHKWYLICSNHRSLVDIPLLQMIFYKRIPFIRFFIKQELFWVPMLGLAWWALDFPFMKRYSRAYLEKHPEKRGKDLETARESGKLFRRNPTTILNFVEGTRHTITKHTTQASPYQHLLRPKAGGVANILASMQDLDMTVLNVTILYPDGDVVFWDLLCGRVRRAIVHIEELIIPPELLHGDYNNDPIFRQKFQEWTQQLWYEKDMFIEKLLRKTHSVS